MSKKDIQFAHRNQGFRPQKQSITHYLRRAPGIRLYTQELSPLLIDLAHCLVSQPYKNKPHGEGNEADTFNDLQLSY